MINRQEICCPLCDSFRIKRLYDFSATHIEIGIPGVVFACSHCGMLFKSFTGDISETYDYQDQISPFLIEYMSGKQAYSFFEEVLRRSKFYRKERKKNPRLLDLGSGLGVLLKVASRLGFEAEGVELSHALAQKAAENGAKIHCLRIEDFRPSEKFEVITMLDVIEHLPNPLEVLRAIRELITPDGELIIYTPNHNAPIVKFAKLLRLAGFRQPLENIFANNHISFFNKQTINLILDKSKFVVRKTFEKPYDPRRPGAPIPFIPLYAAACIDYTGYLVTHSGFRLLIYAEPV